MSLPIVARLMGVPWADCAEVGVVLGKKTILNEFIAYLDLIELVKQQAISERSQIISTYCKQSKERPVKKLPQLKECVRKQNREFLCRSLN